MTERRPPHNLDAKEGVVGSLLIDGEGIRSVALVLQPADFFHEQCAWLYQACQSLNNRGAAIDQITVADELSRMGKLAECGGAAYMSHLVAMVPTALDIEHYADIVKRLSMYRRLADAGEKITFMGHEARGDLADAFRQADDLLLALRKEDRQTTVVSPMDRARRQMDRYEALYQRNEVQALATGLMDLDGQLGGGFFGGDLIIVGGRPGMGKTTFLQQIATRAAASGPVLLASGEMNEDALTDREVATELKVPVGLIRAGKYDLDRYSEIVGAMGTIAERKVYLMVGSRRNPFTTANLYEAASQMQVRYGLGLIAVDYLGLLQDRYGTNQVERLGNISAALKSMAMELNVPVLGAHQLNRASEMRDDKRPRLHDLRDSGNIEQDADVVLFLYRESYYGEPGNVTEILIAKQRQGPTTARMVEVYYDPEEQAFKNLVREP